MCHPHLNVISDSIMQMNFQTILKLNEEATHLDDRGYRYHQSYYAIYFAILFILRLILRLFMKRQQQTS